MSIANQHVRRLHPRLRLGIDATFQGFDGLQSVILYDLSATGAKVLLEHARHVSKGILAWLDYEAFGDISWRKGRWCGIHFDEAISNEWLLGTRALSPTLDQAAKAKLLSEAESFVTGKTGTEHGM
ncbi:PilZ domain-containing protein [Allopontixanthobacter sediminis]|uniref:PilZ domain-containing protein n=1 Tax=Allopontixanthobacter sediminis TaxID=1689985 RepID=A0A845B2N7_9SPHN|nr:PilZ domain-containing protein [Allopontixanthobacter sediminis]MXP44588.1 hypothetical protein [Allopontixanthobacter sediminis]